MRRKSTSGMPVKFRLPDHFCCRAEDHDMVLGATTKVVWKTSSDEVSAYEVVRHDAAVEIDQQSASPILHWGALRAWTEPTVAVGRELRWSTLTQPSWNSYLEYHGTRSTQSAERAVSIAVQR